MRFLVASCAAGFYAAQLAGNVRLGLLDAHLDGDAARVALDCDGHLVPPFVFVYFFDGSELCAPCSWIDSNFSRIPYQRFGSDLPHRRHMVASTHGLLWGADTISRFLVKELFDNPVFQTVEANYSKSSAKAQEFCENRQYLLQLS